MRVVIVDDDTFITGALKTILETTEEIKVVGVGADGREALELYHEYKPDVLLMDLVQESSLPPPARSSLSYEYP